jgi:hypothetical protein
MDNLYGMSLLSVSTLSELHLFQKQNGSPAIRELKRSDAMPDDAIRVCSMIDSYQNNGGERMSEDVFEKVAATKYKLDIIERTEEEARRGMLEGEAFMVIEIQVIGMVENYQGKDSLAIDYIAAFHQRALTSGWMEEKVRSLTDVCEGTVMAVNNRINTRLFLQIRKREDKELCLYRLSAWLSMGDDGSQRWSIRDQINPVFEQEDRSVGKRAKEARRLAGKVMEPKAG